jgi:hypothetical protein
MNRKQRLACAAHAMMRGAVLRIKLGRQEKCGGSKLDSGPTRALVPTRSHSL